MRFCIVFSAVRGMPHSPANYKQSNQFKLIKMISKHLIDNQNEYTYRFIVNAPAQHVRLHAIIIFVPIVGCRPLLRHSHRQINFILIQIIRFDHMFVAIEAGGRYNFGHINRAGAHQSRFTFRLFASLSTDATRKQPFVAAAFVAVSLAAALQPTAERQHTRMHRILMDTVFRQTEHRMENA